MALLNPVSSAARGNRPAFALRRWALRVSVHVLALNGAMSRMACRAVARGNRPAFALRAPARSLRTLRERRLVGDTGLEPVTPAM
jgi:hypothetical protein